jgi:hypothetical protein
MRKVLLILLGFAAVVTAFGAVKFDAKTWRNVQTYDVRTLSKDLRAHVRELMMVKLNFRGKDIHHLKPGWYEGSIWQPDPQGNKGFSFVKVMVSKSDLAAFQSITTDAGSKEEITVCARVLFETDNSFLFLRLIGRNVAVDSSGNATVTW